MRAFLVEDDGIIDVGLGNSFDELCELTACNCGGNLELDQIVGDGPDGLAGALGRLDVAIRGCGILDEEFYSQIPVPEQVAWPKPFPRILKFIAVSRIALQFPFLR